MTKFALKRIEEIDCRQIVDKLIINDKCQFDEFENFIVTNTTYKSELISIYAYIEYAANSNILPNNKCRDITPDKESVKEYEFKSKHLRVYAIKQKNGKIIVLGGFKKNQKKDLKKFRNIKIQYLKTLNK